LRRGSSQDLAPGVGIVAMIVGFILLISINAVRRNEALSLLLFYASRSAKASASRRLSASTFAPLVPTSWSMLP